MLLLTTADHGYGLLSFYMLLLTAADQCLLKQGCAKQRREVSTAATPTLCYKCGEEGHFARGCTKNTKVVRSILLIVY